MNLNPEYRNLYLLTKHPRDVGEELKQMVKKGWLVSEGRGRGMRYRLNKNDLEENHTGSHQNNTTPQVTPQVQKLIYILNKEMSRGEIMEALDLEDRKNFSTLYLSPAIEKNLVELTIPDKPKSSKQKYRLTKLGQEILKER